MLQIYVVSRFSTPVEMEEDKPALKIQSLPVYFFSAGGFPPSPPAPASGEK